MLQLTTEVRRRLKRAGKNQAFKSVCSSKENQDRNRASDRNRKKKNRENSEELGQYHVIVVRIGVMFNNNVGNNKYLLNDYYVPGTKYHKHIILKTNCIISCP